MNKTVFMLVFIGPKPINKWPTVFQRETYTIFWEICVLLVDLSFPFRSDLKAITHPEEAG